MPSLQKISSSQKQILLDADVVKALPDGVDGQNTESKKFEDALAEMAVEVKCATSNASSSDSRGNKDLLGMMNEELEHETELLYE